MNSGFAHHSAFEANSLSQNMKGHLPLPLGLITILLLATQH